MRLPPLPPHALSSASATYAHVSQRNADMCDTCKLAVFEAAAILGNVVRSLCPCHVYFWRLPLHTFSPAARAQV
jgi:hypothetical protein